MRTEGATGGNVWLLPALILESLITDGAKLVADQMAIGLTASTALLGATISVQPFLYCTQSSP